MDTIYATVIDTKAFKVDFVVMNGDIPMYYTLKPGESLIFEDWQTANKMAAPRWDGEQWVETNPPPEARENEYVVWNFDKSLWETVAIPELSPDPMLQRLSQLEEVIAGLTSALVASGTVRLGDMPVQLQEQIQGIANQIDTAQV